MIPAESVSETDQNGPGNDRFVGISGSAVQHDYSDDDDENSCSRGCRIALRTVHDALQLCKFYCIDFILGGRYEEDSEEDPVELVNGVSKPKSA